MISDKDLDSSFSASILLKDVNDNAHWLSRCLTCAALISDDYRDQHFTFHKKVNKAAANGS